MELWIAAMVVTAFTLLCAFLIRVWSLDRQRFWREVGRLTLILVAWWACMFAVLMLAVAVGELIQRDNIGFAIIACLVVFIIGLVGTMVWIPRAIQRVESIEPDPMICTACGYDLRGLPMDRPCPECGQER